MNEQLKVRGEITLKIYKNGRVIERWQDHNIVVNLGRTILSKLLGGAGAAYVLTQIGFGTGTGAEAVGNTALTNAVIKNLGAVTYPAFNAVRFAWTLETNEGNGKAITELGLFTTGGELFSRRVRSVINKTADIRLEGTWTIYF